ncbi:DUF1285 domain-containing protein [Halomonas sp. PAMB 3264]|uniref:DUF1285 domain-containing protein n=1 Tax=Halomonas sp. PAMB 3264 TaxID=3075222 RepID=UPI0028969C1C|nr:DUF1285 domain-containing protein [Halomonas sp. PAMB 3264]WNL43735.1 DUF1285 domain-containing protein [Halomonas sp. PAMB 3264]
MNIDRLLTHRPDSATVPPVDQWHPALSGDIDIVIDADGRWRHEGEPFGRPEIPHLLATLLRRFDEGVCLVTPVERWRVTVEDLPFVIVEADFSEGAWWFTTQFDDVVRLDDARPMTLSEAPNGELMPEIPVRFGLAARLHRNVFYRLVDEAVLEEHPAGARLCLESAGARYPLGELGGDERARETP